MIPIAIAVKSIFIPKTPKRLLNYICWHGAMFYRRIKYFLFPIMAYVSPVAVGLAQEIKPWSGVGIEANFLAGKVYKHEAKFTLPIPELSTGCDMNLVIHTYGKKAWQQHWGYPTLGIGFTYINYGIDSIYGRCFGLYPNIVFPIISGKKLQWILRIGDGIGYVTKEYSRTGPLDTINVAISAHVNDFIMVATDVRYHVDKHWDIQCGANLQHISNGSYRKPNLGINLVGAHAGITYFPVTSHPAHFNRNITPLKKRWLAQLRMETGMVSAYTSGGPLYPVYTMSAYASKRWCRTSKFFAGTDYSYHNDIYAFLRNNDLMPGKERRNSYQSALFAGNEFLIGRVGIMVQAGVYLKQTYLKQDPVYEKVGGNYYIVQKETGPIKELFLSVSLKTHQSVAEMGEIGLGIGF